jgi:NADH:ubiquinone oxidoreductase subunit 2 (subunit N)
MLSLTGVPPASGFFEILFVPGRRGWNLGWLAIIGVITSVISAFLPARHRGHDEAIRKRRQPHLSGPVTTLAVTALGTLVLGLWPGPWLQMAQVGLRLFGG